jgi:hypothetical protein
MQAQWVNNPESNTFIANSSADAGEIYLSTDPVSGDTYVQWTQFASNGWSPTLQRLTYEGVPQWGAAGVHIGGPVFSSYSQGIAMAATTDHAVVSCFSTEAGHCVAVKINADGSFAWGEQGVTLFGGHGGSRTELLAGDDGGVWALGTDNTNSYLSYINADGTLNPTITISDANGKICTFGLMVPAYDGNVFVVYEKESWAYTYFYAKEICVRGYTRDGELFAPDTQLMAEQTIGGSYCHYVVPDGLGGGYVYLWHPAIGGAFNTYVFHFDQFGVSTISDLNGIPVHSSDPSNFYLDAYATVDPNSHDLLIAYQQTDSYSQSQCTLLVNRITETGEKPWGEGVRILDNGTTPCGGLRIDAFEYGGGFAVIYHKGVNASGYQSTVEAKGFDMDCTPLWTTEMCSDPYAKTGDQNSTGFHGGQNIVAWVNSGSGGVYGQNIGQDGTMGEVIPPDPPTPCDAPTNFQGEYVYTNELFGTMLSWDAPETLPLHYDLYREGTKEVIEIAPENTSYFDEVGIGNYVYRLTAVYDDCESNYALTSNGADYVLIEVTSVPEDTEETIVTLLKVYNMKGQRIDSTNELAPGMYIFQGLTQSGKLIHQKRIITKP